METLFIAFRETIGNPAYCGAYSKERAAIDKARYEAKLSPEGNYFVSKQETHAGSYKVTLKKVWRINKLGVAIRIQENEHSKE